MRLRAPITVSALVVAGLVTAGSASDKAANHSTSAKAPAPLLASTSSAPALSRAVGLVTSDTPAAPRKYGTAEPLPASYETAFAAGLPLSDISGMGPLFGALDIPQVVLAAYRNAELRLAQSDPGCGLSWSLLAGIGRIESGHAGGGRTDVAGTTVTPILGPVLDGHLPGNEVIAAADGSYVRAIGPMQFLPGTWRNYAADGNGDGTADPNNVYDATLAAGRNLCAGGLDLRDPAQELRAVLRYNNSMSYAANVLSWSVAYRTGGSPSTVTLAPELIPPDKAALDKATAPGAIPTAPGAIPQPSPTLPPVPADALPTIPAQPAEPMINIPGLPPIPCGIFCPRPAPAPILPPGPGQPEILPAGPAWRACAVRDPTADPALTSHLARFCDNSTDHGKVTNLSLIGLR